MSYTFGRTFRVRHYECDAYGHLNNINYLRYMQETAVDASADAGFDTDRYTSLGTTWQILETEIDFLQPLHRDDRVVVSTWVHDLRRVRSRRAYEFRVEGKDKVAARAFSDWVYLDTQTHRPVAIPEDIKSAFFPDGLPENIEARGKLPASPAAPPDVFRYSRLVAFSDVDGQRHVNNATYLRYIEDAGVAVAAHYGWSMQRLLAMNAGWGVASHHIEYRNPALLEDELEISVWLSDIKRVSSVRNYLIRRPSDDSLIARCRTQYVFLDVARGRPQRIPIELLRDFQDNITEAEREEVI